MVHVLEVRSIDNRVEKNKTYPVCPICGYTIWASQAAAVGVGFGVQCLIHANCPKKK